VGIGLVPRSAVQGMLMRETPVVIEMDEPWAQRDLQVCVRQGAVLSGFAAALVDSLRQRGLDATAGA
jgi:hypothetical protein